MTTQSEIQLRRKLIREGYLLHKGKKSKKNPDGLSGYMIFDTKNNAVAAGSRYELSLNDVEEFLNE